MFSEWRKDVKWIAGILFATSLGVNLVILNLCAVTAERPAVDVMALAAASVFSPGGLDDKAEIEAVLRLLRVSGKKEFKPIPGLAIVVKESDFTGLPPREIRLRFFRRLMRPIYLEGEAGLMKLAESAEMKRSISSGVGFLKFLSRDSHLFLRKILLAVSGISFILLVLLICFSRRFGRLAGPGLVFIIVALPGAGLGALITAAARQAGSAPSPASHDMEGMAGYIFGQMLPIIAPFVFGIYASFLFAGMTLLVWSMAGRIAWRLTGTIYGRRCERQTKKQVS